MNRPAGLTLLELLVALALAAVLAAVAISQWQRVLARWRVDAAARQVVMDLKLARGRAIAESSTRRVRFSVPGGAYQHERQQPSGVYAAAGPAIRLPDGIVVTDCTAVGTGLGFRPRGYAATFGTVTLRGEYGDERRVIVDIVGRMRVQ